MPLPISLRTVAQEMDACPSEWAVFVNKVTGEVLSVPVVEDSFASDECMKDDMERVQAPEFLTLPRESAADDYRLMERFCHTVEDDKTRDALRKAINGKGAFRRFRDELHRVGRREEWFAYKERALADVAADFLAQHGIAFIDDLGPAA